MNKALKAFGLLISIVSSTFQAGADAVVSSPDEASLRSAIAGGGHVTFAFDGKVVLTSPVQITAPVVLDGIGHRVTISGGGKTGLFAISNTQVEFRALTLADGNTEGAPSPSPGEPGGPARGGAIYSAASSVSISFCVLSNNTALGGKQTFISGKAGDGMGGAVFVNGGHLTANETLFVLNQAVGGGGQGSSVGGASGGAVAAADADATLTNCSFQHNEARSGLNTGLNTATSPASGGAVSLANTPSSFLNVIFESNRCDALFSTAGEAEPAHGRGGAVFTDSLAAFNACRVSGNTARGAGSITAGQGQGGGICALGQVTMGYTTVSSNSSEGGRGQSKGSFQLGAGGDALGGGLACFGPLSVTNSTFALNTVLGGPGAEGPRSASLGGRGDGAALYVAGTGYLFHSTVASNTATAGLDGFGRPLTAAGAGGIAVASPGTCALLGVILANGSSLNATGSPQDLGYNISSDTSVALPGTGSRTGMSPLLGDFGFNGGFGETFTLLEGSPARDSASPTQFPAFDQRGIPRPQGAGADIGAVEMTPITPKPRLQVTVAPAGASLNVTIHVVNQGQQTMQVQRSSDLANWVNVGTPSAQSSFDVQDSSAASARFYRASGNY